MVDLPLIPSQGFVESLFENGQALALWLGMIPNGVILVNPEGKIVAANSLAEQTLRLSRSKSSEQVYDLPNWKVTTVDGKLCSPEQLPVTQVLKTQERLQGSEYVLEYADGTRTALVVNAAPLYEQNELVYVVVTFFDISDRAQAETTLRESEQRHRLMVEASAEGMILQYLDGRIGACNSSAQRILGLSQEQILGRTSLDPRWHAIHEDGSPFPGESHPAMVTLQTGEAQSNVVMGVHKPDETLTWISINTRPLVSPETEKLYGVVVSFSEITERKYIEEELLISDAALQQMPDAIILSDLEGNILRWMGKAEEIFGYSAQEAISQPMNFLHHPDLKTQMIAQITEQIQQTGNFLGEISCLRKDGSEVPIETTATTVYDKNGTPRFLVGINRDLTERRNAEAEKHQLIHEKIARLEAQIAQQRAKFLAEASTVLSSSLDYEKTLQSLASLAVPDFADWCAVDILDANGECSRVAVTHRDPQKIQFAWELYERYPIDWDSEVGLPKALRTGESQIGAVITDEILKAGAVDEEHLRILRELGLTSFIVTPLTARGKTLGAITFITAESHRHYNGADLSLAEDLAHRAAIALDNARLYREAQRSRQAAEAAAERTARLQTVTAALSEAVTPTEVANVIIEQGMATLKADFSLLALLTPNGEALEIIKIVGAEAELEESWKCFPLEAPVPLADAVRTGTISWIGSIEERVAKYPHLTHIYERYSFSSWLSMPLIVKGKAIGGITFSFQKQQEFNNEDERKFILALTQQCAQALERARLYESERKARNEAENANRLKDEFLAVVSHELRTPLNSILGWSQMLRSRKMNEATIAKALETIERNARSQKQLIEDLLDVSRIMRGKIHLNIRPIKLIPIAENAIESVRLIAEAKNINLTTHFAPSMGLVSGDAERLQQVIWNLLTNAVKFTPEGGQIEIRIEQINQLIQIQVQDTGIGINPDFLPHVFEHFRQADGSTVRAHGGLGLGLAIVHQLVELHGGTIQAASDGTNQGATFTITLPVLRDFIPNQDSGKFSDSQQVSSQVPTMLKDLKILVVEDQDDTREILQFILEQAGAKVAVAASCAEALAYLQAHSPDLLLSDIGMSHEDGYSLIRKVREMDSAMASIRAIALTAYAGSEDQERTLSAGFQMHISKPVEPAKLVTKIAKLFSN